MNSGNLTQSCQIFGAEQEQTRKRFVHFENDTMGAKRRTSASRGVVKKRTPELAPLTQAEKDVQQERRRIAREEKKALEERVGKMDCLEYSNFIAEQEHKRRRPRRSGRGRPPARGAPNRSCAKRKSSTKRAPSASGSLL